MKTLPDHLERLGVDLDRAARGLAQKRRQRRRVQVAALVAATATVGTSAGLAASGVDVLDWMWPDDPSAVRYIVDESREYEGVAPVELECDSVEGESFPCRPLPGVPEAIPEEADDRSGGGVAWSYECKDFRTYPCGEPGPSQRVYVHTSWVEKAPPATRETFLAEIDKAEEKGWATPAQADEFRDAVNAVSDDFFVKWQRVTSVGGFDTYEEGPAGMERIPRPGVPMFVTCEGTSRSAIRCRPLDEVTTLAVGAPIYRLLPTDDWIAVPRAEQTPEQRWKAFEAIWGGPLTPEEERLFLLLMDVEVDPTIESGSETLHVTTVGTLGSDD